MILRRIGVALPQSAQEALNDSTAVRKCRPAVAALIRAANIELIPLRGAQEKLNVVPAGTKITITCSPKFGLGRTLEYAELAVKAGYEVVPHLAARQVADKGELRDVVPPHRWPRNH